MYQYYLDVFEPVKIPQVDDAGTFEMYYCKSGNFHACNFLRISDFLTFLLVFKFVFFIHPT